MGTVLWILVIVVVALGALLAYAATRPDSFSLSRSIAIEAPVKKPVSAYRSAPIRPTSKPRSLSPGSSIAASPSTSTASSETASTANTTKAAMASRSA